MNQEQRARKNAYLKAHMARPGVREAYQIRWKMARLAKKIQTPELVAQYRALSEELETVLAKYGLPHANERMSQKRELCARCHAKPKRPDKPGRSYCLECDKIVNIEKNNRADPAGAERRAQKRTLDELRRNGGDAEEIARLQVIVLEARRACQRDRVQKELARLKAKFEWLTRWREQKLEPCPFPREEGVFYRFRIASSNKAHGSCPSKLLNNDDFWRPTIDCLEYYEET